MAGPLARLSKWNSRRLAKSEDPVKGAERRDDGIGADAPIKTAAQDRLRRTDFAARIAGILSELSLRDGRVFAIRGEWGFGKSSLKNLITEKLDARDDGADWLEFNPWQWGDGDAIARALFEQIADRLGGEHSSGARARADALRRYGAILNGVSEPIKQISSTAVVSALLTNASVIAVASAVGFGLPTVAKAAAVFAALALGLPWIGRLLSHFGRDRSAEPLDKVRAGLEARLRELDRPLVVFVDDIDRLEPDQIRMLLRQVKANANLPNIVFVLLFQPSIVESALDPVADGDGRAFLEKVVQANFDLPAVPQSVVHSAFGEELSAMASTYATEANGFHQTRWGNAFVGCIQPNLRNMRDARRLLSSIAIHLPLHVSGDVFEVNIVDFLLLETLRVFEPDLHEALFQNQDLVLQKGRYSGDHRQVTDRAAAERLLETAAEDRRQTVRDFLKELFPPLEWAFGGTHYADGWHERWLADKRVCTARFFPRYFELQTTAGEMSESGFVAFLASTSNAEELASAIADIEANGLLPSLAARLDESVDRLPAENAAILLPAMFEIGQQLVGRRALDPFNSPWVSAWRATSWFLKRIPEGARDPLAIEALRQTGALSMGAILIHLNDPADCKDGDRADFDPALDLATVETMKAEWLKLIRARAAEPGQLIDDPDLISLLYRWRDYSGTLDEPHAWVELAVQTDEGFVTLVSKMMSRGTSQGWGDRVSTPHYTFHRSTIEDFLGLEEANARCEAIDASRFPEHKEALETLRAHLDNWLACAG